MSDPNQPYGAVPPPSFPPPGPPSGPPPFGPPYGPPPTGGPGKGKGLWIALAVAGVVALVAVVVVLVLLLTGEDDEDDDGKAKDDPTTSESVSDAGSEGSVSAPTESVSGTDGPSGSASSDGGATPGGSSTADQVANDPEAVVEAFVDSVFAGDCATAEDLVTDAYLQDEGDCEDEDIPSGFGDQVSYSVGTAKVDGDKATVPVTIRAYGESQKGEFYLTRVGGKWLISGTSD